MIRFLLASIAILYFCSYCPAQETERVYLSGKDKDHTVQWDFLCTAGMNSNVWKKIAVPSNWELQGFGSYHYGWEENLKENESGLYKYKFPSNSAWKNKVIRIVFEGSMTDTEVKINGKPAGPIHQGSFYRFKYDITKLVAAKGDNLLDVKVNKISADTSVNRAERLSDFWVFGGIYRPVYLEILPKTFIDHVAIDAKANGTFLMEVYPQNAKPGDALEAQIMTLENVAVGQPFSSVITKGSEKQILKTSVTNPTTWNPESPAQYKVIVRLKNAHGVQHVVTQKFGFRTVEFKEGVGFFVNNQKIMFKGVNRHTFWPTSGRATSKAVSILDVNLIKEMNMNAVRMSHYPPDEHFLDVCDSLGLFVLDELTGWQKKYDTPVGRKLVKEMVVRDVNHPSIVIWDNGNEGGNNFDLDDDFAKYDPQQRHVIHPWNIFRGTDTEHYKGYNCCAGSLYNGTLVFFPTEIIHGLYDGGHGAGLNDHWNLMVSNPLSAGCFLWDLADEGIVRHDKGDIVDPKGDRGADGIVGPYREKEGSFFTIKQIWSPVQIKEQTLFSDFNGKLTVENRYFYTNLNKINFDWQLVKLPSPGKNNQHAVLHNGKFQGPSIAPQEQGVITLPLPPDFRNADVLYLTATDMHNKELFTWSWPLKKPAEINKTIVLENATEKITATEDAALVTMVCNGVTISIDKTNGLINRVKNEKAEISFHGGPILAIGKTEFKSLKHFDVKEGHRVEMTYTGDMKKVAFTMLPSGILKLDYTYFLYNSFGRDGVDFLGVSFNYPEDKITGVTYLGNGPYRVWKNRMKGGKFDVWEKKYNTTITGQSWDYPEFKGYYSHLNWVTIQNKEYPFTIYTDTDNLFLRLYTPDKPAVKNDNTTPLFPPGDISFLHGIGAIGTKFDQAPNHGPEGEKNKIGTEWISGTLYFDFSVKN